MEILYLPLKIVVKEKCGNSCMVYSYGVIILCTRYTAILLAKMIIMVMKHNHSLS